MEASARTSRWWRIAAVAALGVLVTVAAVAQAHEDVQNPGRHSAFTRDELATNWEGAEVFPLLVPVHLPHGAEDAEIGFSLDNIVVDPAQRAGKRVWLSFYESDVLGGRASTFRVFQRPAGSASSARPCGATNQPHRERRFESALLTICSSVFAEDLDARHYWDQVEFTSDLERVFWLRGSTIRSN